VFHKPGASGAYRSLNLRTRQWAKRAFEKQMISERPQPEWLDLKALQRYACVSERTLRQWIHRASNPLPAARVGTKILVRRSTFDHWLENHNLKTIDIGRIVDELVAGVKGTN
jgi:excisionase family DNA binding protein